MTPREQRRRALRPDPLGWALAGALGVGLGLGALLASGCGDSSSHAGWVAPPADPPALTQDREPGVRDDAVQAERERLARRWWRSLLRTFPAEAEASRARTVRVHWTRDANPPCQGRTCGDPRSLQGATYVIHVEPGAVASLPHELGHAIADGVDGIDWRRDPGHDVAAWWGQRGYRTDGRLSAWWADQLAEAGVPDPWESDREPK